MNKPTEIPNREHGLRVGMIVDWVDYYLESNRGRQRGVQFSPVLKDSEALTRLRMMSRSIGCMKHFFIRTKVTNWLSARRMAKTTSLSLVVYWIIVLAIVSRVAFGSGRHLTAPSRKLGSSSIESDKAVRRRSDPRDETRLKKETMINLIIQ